MANYFYEIGFDEIKKTEIRTNDIPNMNGVKNAVLAQQEAAKVVFVKTEIAAGSTVPFHKADNPVLLYFTSGSGKALIQEEDGKITDIALNAGDITLFYPPMKLHAYESGNEGMEYFAVSLPC